MKKTFLSVLLCAFSALCLQAETATIYTKVTGVPKNGWPGMYLIVYENSDTEAYVWNATDEDNNYVKATIKEGVITSETLKKYQIEVKKETSKTYYVHTSEGRIGCTAKSNEIKIDGNGSECTIAQNGLYINLETNTNTCRFLYNKRTGANRFRFYYDKNKEWKDTDLKKICFYALGEIELEEPKNILDINYAQADLYACDSKFPTQSNPYFQYFYTNLRLLQKESEDAVPYIDLEIYAPTQYSIEGTYKSDQVTGNISSSTDLRYWINCQAGSKHSTFFFPSKEGRTQAAINEVVMEIKKVGKSEKPNAYVYHFNLTLTDSNKKTWSLNKDLDVYAQWIECDKNKGTNMDPVPFELESGNHGSGTGVENVQPSEINIRKILRDGQIFILRGEKIYTIQGQEAQL